MSSEHVTENMSLAAVLVTDWYEAMNKGQR